MRDTDNSVVFVGGRRRRCEGIGGINGDGLGMVNTQYSTGDAL